MTTTEERERADSIRRRVDDYLAGHGSVVSAVAAIEIEAATPRDELAAWLWERRFEILAAYITTESRMNGSRRASQERKSVFAENASNLAGILGEEAETGDGTPRQEFFKMWQCGNAEGKPVRKRLGEMNREEVAFHRGRQENSIRYYQRRTRFLKLIEKQLKDGQVVGDIYSPDDLERLLESIR